MRSAEHQYVGKFHSTVAGWKILKLDLGSTELYLFLNSGLLIANLQKKCSQYLIIFPRIIKMAYCSVNFPLV